MGRRGKRDEKIKAAKTKIILKISSGEWCGVTVCLSISHITAHHRFSGFHLKIDRHSKHPNIGKWGSSKVCLKELKGRKRGNYGRLELKQSKAVKTLTSLSESALT